MATHIIIIIMGGILALIAYQMRSKYARFSKSEKVIGTVVKIEPVMVKNTLTPVPVIHFITNSQQPVIKRSEESVLSPRIKKGTKVKVFYNPANPEDFLAQGLQFNTFTLTVLIASIAFMLAGLVLILNYDLKVIHLLK